MKKKNRCADEFPSSSIRKYIGYPDSAYIHFDEVGAVLFIFRANPSLKELILLALVKRLQYNRFLPVRLLNQ